MVKYKRLPRTEEEIEALVVKHTNACETYVEGFCNTYADICDVMDVTGLSLEEVFSLTYLKFVFVPYPDLHEDDDIEVYYLPENYQED